MWELWTSKKIKASQLAGDGGSIISKIIDLESKTKIEFEYVHVTTRNNDDNEVENKGL